MIGRKKAQARAQKPYTIDELAAATAEGLGHLIENQTKTGEPRPYDGLLEIILRDKPIKLNLMDLVDEFDSSPVLIMAGMALAEKGSKLDIALVVKARSPQTGTVTETSVVVTPEGAEPPEERNVIYPPNPEDQRPSVPFNRLAPSRDPSLAQTFIAADAGSLAMRNSMGL